MSKLPPGVHRTVSVLNFFTEHPGQSFTFTEILKALGFGRATCHSLLAGLVEAQYLYRNIDKTYIIGPAFANIGKIAHDQFSVTQVTQPELRLLADHFRAICSTVRKDGNECEITARAGTGQQAVWSVTGERMPLLPPFAGVYFATAKPEELDLWLDHQSTKTVNSVKEKLQEGITFIQQRGFIFGIFNLEMEQSREAAELAFFSRKSEYPVQTCPQLTAADNYSLAFVASPVYNRAGEVEFIMNLSGFQGSVTGEDINTMGDSLREAAERVTYFLNGRSRPYPLPVAS